MFLIKKITFHLIYCLIICSERMYILSALYSPRLLARTPPRLWGSTSCPRAERPACLSGRPCHPAPCPRHPIVINITYITYTYYIYISLHTLHTHTIQTYIIAYSNIQTYIIYILLVV